MRFLALAMVVLAASLGGCGPGSAANNRPTIEAETVTTNEDTPVTVTLRAADPEGAQLTVTLGTPTRGTVSRIGQIVTYTPEPNFNGTDAVQVTVSDGQLEAQATLAFTVTPVNDEPNAVDDSLAGNEDAPLTVHGSALTANDLDVEGDQLTVSAVSDATNGTVSLNQGQVTFIPTIDFEGAASFVYTLTDGASTDKATVFITVGGANDAPIAADDTASGTEDTAVTVSAATLLANDTDAEGQTLTLTQVANGIGGTVALSAGTVTFTPAANFNGNATFSYTVSDGAASDVGIVTVTIAPANDGPIAVDDAQTTPEDTALTVAHMVLTANDSDPEGNALTLTAVSTPTGGTVSVTGTTVTFTPTADFTGAGGFDYEISDGQFVDTAHVTVTVTAANDAPAAVDDATTTAEDTGVALAASMLLANDTDPDGQTLTVSAVSNAANGTVSLSGTTITFTPAANFNGVASFDYTVSDGTATDQGHVTVTVSAVNDAPVAVDDSAATTQGTATTIAASTLLANDTDLDSATLTVSAVSNATNGTVSLSGTTITFTPTSGFNGTAGFDYTVFDGTANDVGHVTVTVTATNTAPTAVDDTASTSEDTALTVSAATLLSNDIDPDPQTLTLTSVSNAVNGTVTLTGTTVTFFPAPDFNGTAGFDYTVSDGIATDAGHVTVTVNAVNDAPLAVDDTASTAQNTAATISAATLLANDTDIDGPSLTVSAVSGATNGTVTLSGTTITFTPASGFSGTAGFDYTVTDGTSNDVGHVTVTVTLAGNTAPVAVDDTASTAEDVPLNLAASTLLANDVDPDPQTLVITGLSPASTGSATLSGTTITYTPPPNFNGTATFEYSVSDGTASDIGLVTVTVTAVNDAPLASPQSVSTPRNTAVSITLSGSDIDPGQNLTFSIVNAPANGTLGAVVATSASTAQVTFTPNSNYAGTDSFTFRAHDGSLYSTAATVQLTVLASAVCGDGFVQAPETCDDGATDPGDGCSASCATESGWSCTGAPSFCDPICNDGILIAELEECDDGNMSDTDGCTTDCQSGAVCSTANAALSAADRFITDPNDGTCYASFDTEALTFSAAQTACIAAGGHLATITSTSEQGYVSFVQNTAENPWIGGTDELVEMSFGWITGEPLTYTNFDTNQPDDSFGNEDCLNLFSTASSPSGTAGKWNDTNCNFVGFTAGRICELAADTCGDTFVQTSRGEQCDDGDTFSFDGCSDRCKTEGIFISEYIEGTGSNQAIEIANPFQTSYNLGANSCALRIYANGASTFSTIALTATIDAQDVFTVCNSGISSTVSGLCGLSTAALTFDGDDAIALVCGTTTIDVVGQIGVDPGSEWSTSNPLVSTADNTLWRKCGTTRGNAGTYDVPTAWSGFATDYFDSLGIYDCLP